MSKRIGLFGGSFNPIHCGHLIVARAIAEKLDLERVILLPSLNPPHKGDRKLLDAGHRAEMVKLAIAGEPLFEFSDYDLTRGGPSYTIDTVLHFRKALAADVELFWLIGADSLSELTTWHRVPELIDACHITTAHRPGSDAIDWKELGTGLTKARVARLRAGVVNTPRIEISSTDVRRRLRAGLSVRYLVPDRVYAYILCHRLYREAPDQASKRL